MSLCNKVALITGGSNGIGLQCAKAMFAAGLKGLMIIDVDEENGKKAVECFGKEKTEFFRADASCFKHLEVGFKKTIEKFQNLDIVVNNAGIMREEEWPKCIDVNLKGVIQGTYLAMRKYIVEFTSGCEGYVVNMSSISGLQPVCPVPVYSATKHAIIGFTRAVGTEFYYNLSCCKVWALCPGVTDTVMLTTGNSRFEEEIECLPKQGAECVGKALVDLITMNPENGTCWIVEGGEPIYQVKFPDRTAMR